MTDPSATGSPITEFASLTQIEDDAAGEFRIVLEGPVRYSRLIGTTVGELRVQRAELETYVGSVGDPDLSASYPLDELVSFSLVEDETFRILLQGQIRFSALISYKLDCLRVQQVELEM